MNRLTPIRRFFYSEIRVMEKLKIAIQKSGRLSEKSITLLRQCGIKISFNTRKLKAEASNFPAEILFLRDDDIPQYVEQGIADIGILGENEVLEQGKSIQILHKLGFAHCRMALAIPKEEHYDNLSYFRNKRIATSYPHILKQFFEEQKIPVTVEYLSGSVEIAPGIGLADGILDIVSTGSTLQMNGLKEVEVVQYSEAVLVGPVNDISTPETLLKEIIFRIKAVQNGMDYKYILLNAPNEAVDDIIKLLPGMKSPTLLPLAESGWSSLHSVVREEEFWEIIGRLKTLGAQGILVSPIEKMVL